MSTRRAPRPAEAATAAALGQSLDRATYAGYVAGFTAARDAAAALAEAGGNDALAASIAALAPLPDRSRDEPGRG
jgi:succinate dehydrogenase/fumarate reductase flavoprotein subunit